MSPQQEPLWVSENFRWIASDNTVLDRRGGDPRPYEDYLTKIDIYEDRVRTWFLDPAAELIKHGQSPSDYIAFSVALAYIEGVEQYRRTGDPIGNSGKWFRASAARIFPLTTADDLSLLYKGARCGLFHAGFTKKPIYLDDRFPEPVAGDAAGRLKVNVRLFVSAACADFASYVASLRAARLDDDLAKSFTSRWDDIWSDS